MSKTKIIRMERFEIINNNTGNSFPMFLKTDFKNIFIRCFALTLIQIGNYHGNELKEPRNPEA